MEERTCLQCQSLFFNGTLTTHSQTNYFSKKCLPDRTDCCLNVWDIRVHVPYIKHNIIYITWTVEKKENALTILSAMEMHY